MHSIAGTAMSVRAVVSQPWIELCFPVGTTSEVLAMLLRRQRGMWGWVICGESRHLDALH